MNHAIRIHEHGGPEVLRWEEVPMPSPGPGEALVKHAAVGLNYIDIYFRTGLYKPPALPATIGMEGAGTVEAVGEGVTDLKPGDRVAYATAPIGAYAQYRTLKADRLVKLPDAIGFEMAAAMMLQGMTAEYLLRRTFKVQPGQTILIVKVGTSSDRVDLAWRVWPLAASGSARSRLSGELGHAASPICCFSQAM
jgi:NADPH2:quinone reductase